MIQIGRFTLLIAALAIVGTITAGGVVTMSRAEPLKLYLPGRTQP